MAVSKPNRRHSRLQLAPDLAYRAARSKLGDSDGEDADQENPLQEYLDDGGLQQLSTLHNKYEAIKQQVFKGSSPLVRLLAYPGYV